MNCRAQFHSKIIAIILLAAGSLTANAETAYTLDTALWGAFAERSLSRTPVNDGNQIARIPGEVATFEARPDFKLTHQDLNFTLRPRLIFTAERTKTSAHNPDTESGTVLMWNEVFLGWNAAERLTVTYGLQNYQWGPAESASPSNRIFRDTIQLKDILYIEKGKHLVRVNWTPSGNWSEVLLYEVSGNDDPEFEAGEPYAKKALLKSEYSWGGGANYLGVVTGWREPGRSWLGEYANVEVTDGLYLFFDASHQRGSLAYYPVADATGSAVILDQSRKGDARIYTYAVSGARYAFENGIDARLEWIYQEAGYSSAEMDANWDALTSLQLAQLRYLQHNALAAVQNGLDFPGRQYGFASVRVPNVLNVRDWTLYLRALQSLQDRSNSTYFSSENAIGTKGTLFSGIGFSSGRPESELKGLIQLSATAGYRQNF